MSRNGSGTYTLPAGNPVVTGTTITSSWANTTMQNIADGLTQSVSNDGQTPMTGALNMANNKIISVTDPTNAQDAATKAYVDTADALSLLKANNLSDVANATTSRTNLVAAKSGANSDITSLSGLTTPLTVAQGGVGAATLAANYVLLGNGTSAVQTVAPSTSGNLLTSNGTTWVSSAPSVTVPIPAGSVMLFYQSAAPTGWTQVTTLNDYDLRLVSGAGGTTGGTTAYSTVFANQTVSTTVSGTSGATTISTAQMPSHNHTMTFDNTNSGGAVYPFDGNYGDTAAYTYSTSSTGGGGSHTHSFSGSGTSSVVTLNVRYANIIICSKN